MSTKELIAALALLFCLLITGLMLWLHEGVTGAFSVVTGGACLSGCALGMIAFSVLFYLSPPKGYGAPLKFEKKGVR